jgi:hypothetical protein
VRLEQPSNLGLVTLISAVSVFSQNPPASPGRPWHSPSEREIAGEAQHFGRSLFRIESEKVYSLAELIDLAEAHNPETRVAWENARAQAASLGIARSELYPVLSATAVSGADRSEAGSGSRFYRQMTQASQVSLELSYTVFDFGAVRGRVDAASARVLASNFGFNDVHRQLIYRVQQAYYRLLNASAQETAAHASLANAQAVQQAAEERLKNGLATLPDVLEARSATAQAQFDLQTILGTEQVAQGDLATVLGASAGNRIRVQPFSEGFPGSSHGHGVNPGYDHRHDVPHSVYRICRSVRADPFARKRCRDREGRSRLGCRRHSGGRLCHCRRDARAGESDAPLPFGRRNPVPGFLYPECAQQLYGSRQVRLPDRHHHFVMGQQ